MEPAAGEPAYASGSVVLAPRSDAHRTAPVSAPRAYRVPPAPTVNKVLESGLNTAAGYTRLGKLHWVQFHSEVPLLRENTRACC